MGGAELAQDGGDGYDCAAAAREPTFFFSAFGGGEHAWEEGADGVEVGEEVYVHGTLDFGVGKTEEGFAVRDAGVVEEDCGRAELLFTS